jgi:hypothetical protein
MGGAAEVPVPARILPEIPVSAHPYLWENYITTYTSNIYKKSQLVTQKIRWLT